MKPNLKFKWWSFIELFIILIYFILYNFNYTQVINPFQRIWSIMIFYIIYIIYISKFLYFTPNICIRYVNTKKFIIKNFLYSLKDTAIYLLIFIIAQLLICFICGNAITIGNMINFMIHTSISMALINLFIIISLVHNQVVLAKIILIFILMISTLLAFSEIWIFNVLFYCALTISLYSINTLVIIILPYCFIIYLLFLLYTRKKIEY